MTQPNRPDLPAIFLRFLRFGLLAWGGPVAQIGMIKRELVDEAQWLSAARFNRLLAVYQVLPGPEAHEISVHLGMMKGGRLGGLLAGLGFMLPGLVLVLALAWIYQQLDLSEPRLAAVFLGAQVGVIALIAAAIHRIGRHALVDRWLWGIGAVVAVVSLAGIPFWITLPASGLAYAAIRSGRRLLAVGAVAAAGIAAVLFTIAPGASSAGSAGQAAAATAGALFVTGLKAGLLTFGGAYTSIPFVRDDSVGRGWISESQFLDGLALSGIIPAPLIIFATFVGFQAAGLAGALAITVGIFLPAFGFSLLFFDKLERVMEEERLHHFLEGITAGVVGLIVATTVQLAAGLVAKVPDLLAAGVILAASLATLYLWRSKLAVPVVVFASAAIGLIAFA